MFESVLKWISENYPTLGVVIVIVVIAVYLTTIANRWRAKIKKSEEDCKKIEGQLMPQITGINTALTSLSGSFRGLVIHLQAKKVLSDTGLFMSKSPIRLTDLGREILSVIGGKEYVEKNVESLIKAMDAEGIKSALDTQTIAPIVITKISENNDFKHIKDYAFNNPLYHGKNAAGADAQIAIDMDTISMVMGIYLRDKYLERHPELNPEDIPSI